jgi:hypothetical protein
MTPADGDPRLTIAYEESVRAWALQSSVLDELRNRAGVLLSAASVSSAFLGAKTLEGTHGFSAASIAATVVFGLIVLLCVFVLWPTKDWTFTHDARALVEAYVDEDSTLDAMRREMTLDNTQFRIENGSKMKTRFLGYKIACFALGIDVILWLIDLGTRG